MRVIFPSLNYGDYLEKVIPDWKQALGRHHEYYVVTAPRDVESMGAALRNNIRYLTTEAWFVDNADVNVGLALDHALSFAHEGEVCLTINADTIPGEAPFELPEVEPDTIYGVNRFGANGLYQEVANIPYIKRRGRGDCPQACGGYFQLFRYSSERKYGSYPSAATVDYEFAFQFPKAKLIEGRVVVHLSERRANWNGRVTPKWAEVL